jgi:hypothetical protein
MACSRGKASPDKQTTLRLFAASGGFCQNPQCQRHLFVDTDAGNIHVAEMAHVFAANDRGPRANSELSAAERGDYENLVLLCSSCHTIVDKASKAFPDTLLVEWKREHTKRIAATFGAINYTSRAEARAAIEPILAENRLIFDEYGPDNEYRHNPESEAALTWQRKVRSKILPNNRKILAILDANRSHLKIEEKTSVEQFRQHVDDLEARHIAENVTGSARRFPPKMQSILLGSGNA